jgi:hypothetical protein
LPSATTTSALVPHFSWAISPPWSGRDLATQHALRGYDAVHLACALHLEGDDILLATWGHALNAAARATGELVANDTG